ncbi:TetR family transcriptional regulator [Goodfellowiella coeruleoviolacea]|uniref:Transcriptional regulator, TetR family n=1 Tax=Goodfellowiella coeruleoviolacea TaxID=334858 RepID=A0AAE3GC95_9PSEU|nr:TetR family transcriptional regulator [Goodfellowiella coeruleoviolacea]MCP2165153.1 transcriptional regulator, TetR family [Goodfellowiella coeruleoviolacea]
MPRDSQATKARIFAAAAAEFAAHGIAGSRVERIAAQAGANKQLIYAYFGDKERLFAQVLEHELNLLAKAVPVEPDDLETYPERLYEYYQRHPEVGRLLLWEALELTGQPVPSEAERTAHYADKAAAIATAQQRGAVTREFTPDMLVLLLISLVAYPMSVTQVRRMLLGGDTRTQQDRTRAAVLLAARRLMAPAEADHQRPSGEPQPDPETGPETG